MSAASAAPAISEATLTALGATFRDIKIDNTVGKDATVELALTNDDGHVFGNLKVSRPRPSAPSCAGRVRAISPPSTRALPRPLAAFSPRLPACRRP